jgi:hypothetical protein
MVYRALADLVVLLHASFIIFAVLGALLALRWPRVACVHLPCVAWGILLEFNHWVCPLTPLELWLRSAAGTTPYSGGFIDHYLVPAIYPADLSSQAQSVLAVLLLAINLALYAIVLWRWRAGGAGGRLPPVKPEQGRTVSRS